MRSSCSSVAGSFVSIRLRWVLQLQAALLHPGEFSIVIAVVAGIVVAQVGGGHLEIFAELGVGRRALKAERVRSLVFFRKSLRHSGLQALLVSPPLRAPAKSFIPSLSIQHTQQDQTSLGSSLELDT